MNWSKAWLQCARIRHRALDLMRADSDLPHLFRSAAELRGYLTRHGCPVTGPLIDRLWKSYKGWTRRNPVLVTHSSKVITIRAL